MDKDQHLNQLFDAAKDQPVAYTYEDIKSNFLSQTTSAQTPVKRRWFNGKIGIIMLGILTTIGVIAWMSYSPKIEDNHQKNTTAHAVIKTEENLTNNKDVEEKTEQNIQPITKREYQLLGLDMKAFELNHELTKNEPVRPKQFQQGHEYAQLETTPYLPKLTEAEIKANNKRKKKMIKSAGKYDKDYSYIPANSANLNGDIVSVAAFHIQTKEVSVLEYKTFLFDLIIQGKTEEFHKAKPDFEQWIKIGGQSCKDLVDTYFSDEKYNDYPINNISREGAELYCKWLTLEVVKEYGNAYNDFRIPTRKEWEMAATWIGNNKVYPWGTSYITNADSCFLANFNLQQYMKANNWSSVKCDQIVNGWEYRTVPVYSYNPNGFGLYNMSGNVAEMVWDVPKKEPKVYKKENLTESQKKQLREEYLASRKAGTAGGGWMDSAEEIEIFAPDKYPEVTNAHPNIGFRVVTTYISKQALEKMNSE